MLYDWVVADWYSKKVAASPVSFARNVGDTLRRRVITR